MLLELAAQPGNGMLTHNACQTRGLLTEVSLDRHMCGLQDAQPSLGVVQPRYFHLVSSRLPGSSGNDEMECQWQRELCEHTP